MFSEVQVAVSASVADHLPCCSDSIVLGLGLLVVRARQATDGRLAATAGRP